MSIKSILLLCCLLATVSLLNAQTSGDTLVTSLPGYNGKFKSRSYTGYLLANATRGHHLFYWFFESQSNPATDPVVLWTNGGPGCSSLEGESTENGPLFIQPDGKTILDNPYTWNRKASIIYVEHPIGVGFSYSEHPEDYKNLNDDQTTLDLSQAVRDFFLRFPQYTKNDFYISGESYAGVYIPLTASRIIQGNARGLLPKINLKGLLIGNGVTDGEADANSIPLFYNQHSIIPIDMYKQGVEVCKGDFYKNQNSADCARFLDKTNSYLDNIDPYYLYDSCVWNGDNSRRTLMRRRLNVFSKQRVHPLFQRHLEKATSKKRKIVGAESDFPCVPDHSVISYFNSTEVQQALGIRRRIDSNPLGWQVCNMYIQYTSLYPSILPFYRSILADSDVRILVYSGDVDGVVNTLGTQAAIDKLGYSGKPWSQWTHKTEEGVVVDGMIRHYSPKLTFITIRGAGHMVPLVKPLQAMMFFEKFLNGTCC